VKVKKNRILAGVLEGGALGYGVPELAGAEDAEDAKKCNDKCFCKFNYDKNQIKNNSFILPMFTYSNCQLSRCIYILICVKCNIYYIGQTGRSFSDRFYQHAYNIKKFKAIVNEKSELAQHFNLKTHNYINDLKSLIFKDKLELSERLSIENDLINLFLT
jgi:hypothetical protein